MYPADLVMPMKADLTDVGFKELTNAAEVDAALQNQSGTTFLVINSVWGSAAGSARPAVQDAVKTSAKLPSNLVTAFAGVDTEATARAREYTLPYPPSSPSMALFKDGKLVHFIERHQIEGNNAATIAEHLKKVFEHFC